MNDIKENYLNALSERLTRFYQDIQVKDKLDDIEKHRIEAFIEAALVSGLAAKDELQDVIDAVHFSVFGRTLEEQAQYRKETMAASGDYSMFDKPAWVR
ncbi:hypothetical protein HBA55_05770 [Pseudomaricurvus alkylphenolicus]|uniref:hypothetical protein n=1 Tax=Pseudomaricurvus alkylphenolicus TaxID=1306991 RepID=UPI0014241C5D|nr:hypothetical protein [Pseudomaricurvus alkylphenolicus]NIB39083.1 hypothetical protein [Pseudomaricurvus alkylphenolicus]